MKNRIPKLTVSGAWPANLELALRKWWKTFEDFTEFQPIIIQTMGARTGYRLASEIFIQN